MKIGIIADLHNNLSNWVKTNELLGWQGARQLIIAGDITNTQILDKIAQDFLGLIHVVFGNMDQQTELMKILIDRYANLKIYGFHGEFIIDQTKFIVNHYEEEAKGQLKENEQAVLICGHTHEKKEERTKKYLLINPGTVGGIFQKASFAIFDTQNKKLNFIDL